MMLRFLPGAEWFAVAGALAAAGPIVIHLLHRRRFRVVEWAAMDFLLQALERRRRMMRLRDLWLLVLRSLCLLLFGLALARPYWASRGSTSAAHEPVHAILVIDNSLSMSYQLLGETLLDRARRRARDLVDELPPGSRFTILPLCGSRAQQRPPFAAREDALDAIAQIGVVDRAGSLLRAIELAREAPAPADPPLPRRTFLFGDRQANQWPSEPLGELGDDLPEIEWIQTTDSAPTNSWVESLSLDDGWIAPGLETSFVVALRHSGTESRRAVPVTLSIDGVDAASQVVDLEPGAMRQVTFPFRLPENAAMLARATAGNLDLTATVALPADRLPLDDRRALVVPVAASLPVLFVDQYGPAEDPRRGTVGETRQLRRLLTDGAPGRDSAILSDKHLTLSQLDDEALAAARLVVLAGVPAPTETAIPMLRGFVERGGQLLIAAGGSFDPAAWHALAWREGAGILPAPLSSEPIGSLPDVAAAELRPFFLAPESMTHELFRLPGAANEELHDLFSTPYFFKAVEALFDATAIDRAIELETRRLLAQSAASGDPGEQRKAAAAQAERTRPQVLARFQNQAPFLVARQLGRGQVVLIASGVHSSWNNLPRTNAVLLLDRLMRWMLSATFPRANFAPIEEEAFPIQDRSLLYELTWPSGASEPLAIDALGADRFGVTVRSPLERGIYRLTGRRPATADRDAPPWRRSISVCGPASESELTVLSDARLNALLGGPDRPLGGAGLAGSALDSGGRQLWKWLIGAVLAGLILELVVLARPFASRPAASAASAHARPGAEGAA